MQGTMFCFKVAKRSTAPSTSPHATRAIRQRPSRSGSYNGQATINSGTNTGCFVYGVGGVWIVGLTFTGKPGSGTQSGINFEMYWGNAVNDRVHACTISGYHEAGILIEGTGSTTGVNGLQITSNSIHDNVETGIYSVAANDHSIVNLYVGYNQVYNNYGDGTSFCTGSGIELADVNGAMVEYNTAYLNGSRGGNGGVGIWAYSSNNVTFQYNDSYDNLTTRGNDGDGFDFDADVSNSLMQYNFASGNDGAGFALNQWWNDNDETGDVVRYNISQNNGRKDNYAGIDVWGKVENAKIYNNTVYAIPGINGVSQALRISNNEFTYLHPSNVDIIDNIFVSTGGTMLVNATAAAMNGASNIVFAGNDYYSSGSTFRISYDGVGYNSLTNWQSRTGEEKIQGKSVGLALNPLFRAVGQAQPLAAATNLRRSPNTNSSQTRRFSVHHLLQSPQRTTAHSPIRTSWVQSLALLLRLLQERFRKSRLPSFERLTAWTLQLKGNLL